LPETSTQSYFSMYQLYRDAVSWKMMQEKDSLSAAYFKSVQDPRSKGQLSKSSASVGYD
jgi:hypothetical protein